MKWCGNGVRFAALACLVAMDCPQREPAIAAFESKWSKDELVMQSWFSVQAVCPLEGTLARVRELMKHPVRAANSIFFTGVCCTSCTFCSLTVVFAGVDGRAGPRQIQTLLARWWVHSARIFSSTQRTDLAMSLLPISSSRLMASRTEW